VADLLYGAQKWLLFQTTEFKELCQKATITDKDVWSFCQGQVSSLDYYGCEASEIEAALKTRDFGVQRLSDRPDCIKEIAAHIVDSIGKVFKPKQTGGSISSRFHHKKTVAQPIDDAKWLENLIKELRKQDPSFGNPAQPEET
jgi:hypothetical protein